MNNDDYAGFAKVWTAVWSSYGRRLDDVAVELDFETLKNYTLQQITGALAECKRQPDRKYPPTTNDVVLMIDGSNKLPSVDRLVGMAIASKNDQHHSPIAFFARMEIGDFRLSSMSMYDLRPYAEEALAKLPDFIENARMGNYGANQLSLMRKHGFSAADDLAPGIKGPPESIHDMVGQALLHFDDDTPKELPALTNDQQKANIARVRQELRGVVTPIKKTDAA